MRNALFSLLILSATFAFGAQVHVQSPALFAEILTSGQACTQGINRAQAVAEQTDGTTYLWSISNGVIVDGQGTSVIHFTPIDGREAVLTVRVEWRGASIAVQATIPVFDPPTILRQPKSATVPPGTSVTLTVEASNDAFFYDWYEGLPGDTSKVVLPGAILFKTPPLTKTTSYWVRVSGRCGATASQAAIVTVDGGRRRAARR
jgi:hypothetical protein